ncbi:MAG: DegT/DnrJ/EryC1/StrS family aminotransferase [Planctomycetota bacterium]
MTSQPEETPSAPVVESVPLLDVNRDNAPLRDEFVDAVTAVIDSGRFLFGPDVAELECEMAGLCQVENAVGCASGSDALLLALMALEIGPGDEVIVPSFTFFASVSCITRLGATPVFADICPETFNVSPDAVANLITEKTAAIIPVHLFGQCAQIDRICEIASEADIPVVEDAAQAIGAAYANQPAGSWGLCGCFSYYPTKNLGGMGDGGMLTSNDAAMADRLRLLAGHGMRPRYYHQAVGINSRLDSFQAAVLRVKLKHLDSSVQLRRANAARYDRLLMASGLVEKGAITLPRRDAKARHVWNQYAIRVADGRRDDVRGHLAERQVGTEIYYPVPMHKQDCFQNLSFRQDSLVETDLASSQVLNLPIFPSLTEAEQVRVVDCLASYFAMSSRAAA